MIRKRRADPARERLRAEQIRQLYHSGPTGTVAALIAAYLLAVMIWYLGVGSKLALVLWLVVILLDVIFHMLLAHAYHRRSVGPTEWRPWAYGFVGFSFLEGLIWGVGCAISLRTGHPRTTIDVRPGRLRRRHRVRYPPSGVYLPAFYALFLTASLPFMAGCLMLGGFLHDGMAALIAVYIGGMLAVSRLHNGNIMEMLRLRFENADLAAELRVQKDAAEEASLAKTRFLASASHDLRQPVHALGLFVGALRAYNLDDAPRQLVDRIEDSVTAMDGLFSALLDISRLDAGVVAPEWQVFAIQPLLERVARAITRWRPRQKGVALRVRSAPLVRPQRSRSCFERILRNLVSNAVRYTRSRRRLGRMPQACHLANRGVGYRERHRTGASAARVRGILPARQSGERDRARGLGLGLAIVRRLAGLLGHATHIASRPGRGSLFAVDVPLAEAARARLPPRVPRCLAGVALFWWSTTRPPYRMACALCCRAGAMKCSAPDRVQTCWPALPAARCPARPDHLRLSSAWRRDRRRRDRHAAIAVWPPHPRPADHRRYTRPDRLGGGDEKRPCCCCTSRSPIAACARR